MHKFFIIVDRVSEEGNVSSPSLRPFASTFFEPDLELERVNICHGNTVARREMSVMDIGQGFGYG